MSRLVRVYKGSRAQETYLYVDYQEDLARVPESLLERLGTLQQVMSLKLAADRTLARADAGVVLAQIETAGFYLQLPPPPERRSES